MIEVAAGILLAVLILLFLGPIFRVMVWLATALILIVALVVILMLPGEMTTYLIAISIFGGCGIVILNLVLRLTSEESMVVKSTEPPALPSSQPSQSDGKIWLGDGRRIVTAAFGPFQAGAVIDHWQADYVRVFIGDREFSPAEVAEKSLPFVGSSSS